MTFEKKYTAFLRTKFNIAPETGFECDDNTTQALRKREQHICPLPFDIVNRLIVRYTNEGETVLDPFCGIGTVPYCALKLDRRGVGIELCAAYASTAADYCREAEEQRENAEIITLFDMENVR